MDTTTAPRRPGAAESGLHALRPEAASPAVRHTLVLHADRTFGSLQREAVADLVEGFRLWRLGLTLGWLDIRLRYRGSVLGPFWLTLSTAVMVAALGTLYSTLFKMNLHEYLPFLALSLVLWNSYMAAMVGDACQCFLQAEGLVRSIRMPFTLHATRTVVRNLLVLAHNVVVIVAVWAIFDAWPRWSGALAVPGLALWLADSYALCLVLGTVCARFRDIPPIVGSLMQIAFFVTPIIWKPDLLQASGGGQWLLYNPFYSLLEVVRAPLLSEVPSVAIWISALGYSAMLCLISWLAFARLRGRLAFWV